MKNWLVFFFALTFTGCLSFHPNRDTPQSSAPELTADQRERDLRALFTNLKEMNPLVHGYAQSLGLPDILAQEEAWVQEARQCKNNQEFAVLVGKVVTWAGQTGHSLFPLPPFVNSSQEADAHLGLSSLSYSRMTYWQGLAGKGYRLAHSQFPVEEDGAGWFFSQPFETVLWRGDKPEAEKVTLPAGTRLVKIEGRDPQEWINQASLEALLLWDPDLKKLRPRPDMDPFLLDPGKGIRGWKALVRSTPEAPEISLLIPKIQGVKGGALIYPKDTRNITTRILDSKTAYIKIFSFLGGSDLDKSIGEIHEFLKDPATPTEHLIVDVRFNQGGDPRFWLEGLIRPLIDEPLEYKVKYLVTDRIETYGNFIDESLARNPELKAQLGRTSLLQNIKLGRENGLNLWKGTFSVSPLDLGIQPRRVSLLVNEGCFSATEILAQVCKSTGFARVYGRRTAGGATSVAMAPPLPFTLPESGITIQIETSLTYNADGTVNQIDRTLPDVVLPQMKMTADLSVPALLKDPWIQAVMSSQ